MASLLDEQQQWLDSSGTPLVGGFIYIGTQNADPVLNPKAIFSDRELTTPLSQPQTIDANGRSSNKIWTDGPYSIEVQNVSTVQVYSELDNGESTQGGITTVTNVLGANTITGGGSPAITAYVDKEQYVFTAAQINTGAVTLNIDSLGAKSILKNHTDALEAGDLEEDQVVIVVYNGTDDVFEWTNQNLKYIEALFVLPNNYLINAKLANNGVTPLTKLDTLAVEAKDSTNTVDIILSAGLIKQIDATWVVGDDVGGLAATLTVANNTWYHVFAVLVGGVADIMFDTSVTCATGVAQNAVTNFKLLGSVLTDGSANILPFTQTGNNVILKTTVSNYNSTAARADAPLLMTTPIDYKAKVNVAASFKQSGTSSIYIYSLDSNQPINATIVLITSIYYNNFNDSIITNTSGQISLHVSATVGVGKVDTLGWEYIREAM